MKSSTSSAGVVERVAVPAVSKKVESPWAAAERRVLSSERMAWKRCSWAASTSSTEVRISEIERIADTLARMRWMASPRRSEEHTSELQSLMRISYAVFCLKKKNNSKNGSVNTK